MNTPSGSASYNNDFKNLSEEVRRLSEIVLQIKAEMQDIQKSVISHENELKQRKVITNSYTDSILSKIEILENIIQKNIENTDQFISPHLLEVQSIKEQIKQTGKISDKQFKTLNDIYLKQKRI